MGAVSHVVEAVFEPIKQVGKVAESVVREVGHAAESVGREVGKVGQAAVDDPVGTIAKVAAIATQQYWALPLISAATVIAHGGNLGQAALAAGISYAAGAIAIGVGEALGAAGSGAVDMMSADAVSLANQGLTGTQISEILQQSYGVSGDIAGQTAAQAAIGQTAAEIAKDIGGQMATQNLLASAAGNMVGGAARTALSGGDLNQVLMGGLTSGAGSLAGGYASQELKDLGINNTVANVLGKATGAATASTIAGKDAKLSFINSLINTSLSEGGKQVGSGLKSAWNSVNEAATSFNTQLTKAQEDYTTKLSPLEQEAKAAQEIAAKSFDEYKPIRDQFSDLVKQYDEAKAAGDTEKANSLADQANALIPQLNAATDKYNTDVATFDSKLATYDNAAKDYKTQTDNIESAKKEYEARNANLQETTKAFTETALKVADMSDNSKTAFQKLYDNGTDLTQSFDTAKTLNDLSKPAQDTFLRQYDKNGDLTGSLEFANKINSLDTNSQASYSNAVNTGLDDDAALQYAPNLSALSKESQQVFFDGIKAGQDPRAAEMSAAMAEFLKQSQSETTPPASYAPTASTNTTGSMTDVGGGGASTPLVNVSGGYAMDASGKNYLLDDKGNKIPLLPMQGSSVDTGTQTGAADKIVQIGSTKNPDGTITEKYSDGSTKVFNPDTSEYITQAPTNSTGSGTSSILNNSNLADNAFTGTSTTPTTGTAPTGGTTGTSTSGTPVATVKPGFEATPSTATGDSTFNNTGVNGAGAPSTGTPTAGGPTTTGGASTGTGTAGSGTGTTGTGSGSGTSGSGVGAGAGVGIGMGTGTGGYNYNYGTSGTSNDMYGGIKNLTPGLTQKMDYTLSGMPNIQESTSQIPNFATGSSVNTDPFSTGYGGTSTDGSTGISSSLTPGLTKAQLNYVLTGMPGHADGGSIEEEHNPTFFSEGGLGSIDNRYVQGEGDGTSDSVAAMLANGEFVIPADVVSKIGNGSNEAGAGVLDQFLVEIRKHAQSNGVKLPPDSKGPLAYLLDAKRKVKA